MIKKKSRCWEKKSNRVGLVYDFFCLGGFSKEVNEPRRAKPEVLAIGVSESVNLNDFLFHIWAVNYQTKLYFLF